MNFFDPFPPPTRPGTVGLIGTVKDEGPWLIEWVAHNKVLGFDEIAVASNDCSDGTDLILDRMEEMGLLTHIDNPGPYKRTIQMDAYYALQDLPVMRQCEWLMPMDADEFLVINIGDGTVKALIEAGDGCHRIPVRWRIFGDSSISGFVDPPITEKLFQAARRDDPQNAYFKALVREHHNFEMNVALTTTWRPRARFGPYRLQKLKYYCDGEIIELPQGGPYGGVIEPVRHHGAQSKTAQINHYSVRTRELCQMKRHKGDVNNNQATYGTDAYFNRLNLNHEEDRSALRYATQRNALMQEWLCDPRLKELQQEAVEFTRNRLEVLAGERPETIG
ncbi:glycosyltransferase family 2 protein [Ruegeria atlantica]|uniref:glycosyltransferase family 2 protein n=1 Tax=Ruegeria atlantica TaxID=81569 RepID=UPI002494C478|nr:glycosyltransferase family 2 protein [Ruegeria atlantica]